MHNKILTIGSSTLPLVSKAITRIVEPRLAHTVSAAEPSLVSLVDISLLPKTASVAASNQFNSYCSCYSWQVLRCLQCTRVQLWCNCRAVDSLSSKKRFILSIVFMSLTVIRGCLGIRQSVCVCPDNTWWRIRARDISSINKKFGKVWFHGFWDMRVDRKTGI